MLSIIGIFGILNNWDIYKNYYANVVICFQLLVSLVFWTTGGQVKIEVRQLWFAFNYWYLWYSEQLMQAVLQKSDSCDLLSIIGIFGILNNRVAACTRFNPVVICFQLLVSLVFWTTMQREVMLVQALWFAFNYWYLWYSEQPSCKITDMDHSCDLLSIIGIFGILNNK